MVKTPAHLTIVKIAKIRFRQFLVLDPPGPGQKAIKGGQHRSTDAARGAVTSCRVAGHRPIVDDSLSSHLCCS